MAATSIMSTDEEMNAMAGENVDETGWTDENKTAWGLQAECFLNNLTRFNFSDGYNSLNVDVKYMLNEYVARYVAICGITYNMAGYGTDETAARVHAEDMINIHLYRMNEIKELLQIKDTSIFMENA